MAELTRRQKHVSELVEQLGTAAEALLAAARACEPLDAEVDNLPAGAAGPGCRGEQVADDLRRKLSDVLPQQVAPSRVPTAVAWSQGLVRPSG